MIGIDAIEVSRFEKKKLAKKGSFVANYFSPAEIDYAESKGVHQAETLAGIFAAKEAVRKAFGDEEMLVSSVEICHRKSGQPFVKIVGKTRPDVKISITHTGALAISVCVIQ